MKLNKFALITVFALLVGVIGSVSAFGASVTFSPDPDQPEIILQVTSPVEDDGCDYYTVMMTDADGLITDIDSICVDITTGEGNAYTDWWSYAGATGDPQNGPITYSVFNTGASDDCYLDENSVACANFLFANLDLCVVETTFQPDSLPEIAPFWVCSSSIVDEEVDEEGNHVCRLDIPDGSVVGEAPFGGRAYYAPGHVTNININPGTYIVIGQDESETYYKIVLACQYLWVLKDLMQPSFQYPQNGTPLPITIVS